MPVTETDASDNAKYKLQDVIDKTVWVVKNGRVIGTSTDKALTKIEIGDSELLRSNYIGMITDVGSNIPMAMEVTANKVITISLYNYDERITNEVNLKKDKTL